MKRIAYLLLVLCSLTRADTTVGSKKFTESVILGEIASQTIAAGGHAAQHRRSLGGTRVLWSALLGGDIDLYAEYTGTLLQEILPSAGQSLGERLAAHGVGMTAPLGFENTYALGMLESRAASLDIRSIGDLRDHPRLTLGFSNEFMSRPDGWPGLRQSYALPHSGVRGMDHDLAYRGLASGALDVTDLYSTDAEIAYYGLRVLRDERAYFPEYQAVFIYRLDWARDHPSQLAALRSLAGSISAQQMAAMNAHTKLQGEAESEVAASFLRQEFDIHHSQRQQSSSTAQRIARRTAEHLVLVGISLSGAIVVGIPLGIVGRFNRRAGQIILAATGIIQTIPALALLVFMIPFFGIGGVPAVAALFLYSLLPIVRNTYTGLWSIPTELRLSAEALGLPALIRLRRIELPLAAPTILAGIKTSAVINIGTATLGALIGAGGYGQPILTGIRLDDMGLILEGAVPAAAMALLTQALFELLQRRAFPRGMG